MREPIYKAEDAQLVNRAAREQMKLKLLADIRIDLMICEIEGWDKKKYLNELKELINGIGNADRS